MTGGAPEAARVVFGERVELAERFAELLHEHGIRRGLIGPRELDRLWERHLLNSAVIAELLPPQSRVVDVGSGAGLPGIPLAIARPDLTLTLLEPMARRVTWLQEVITELALTVEVVRGRAEEGPVRERLADQDVVTARAVAPMERLAKWSLPLLRQDGLLLAMKGDSAAEELERDAAAIAAAGGGRGDVKSCGVGVLDVPTTVVVVERVAAARTSSGRRRETRRARKERGR
ncbi:16S rRNA (guanine(527)-N(7))-methyltransferase RsmG [Saccharopolyspora karakumensis]|uniref:Ribosomal RNA small subunit methyltransferase G n=1 Tax=Saccharopolyspora karakumensis TaxID=2530386 RepID=A0A4R5BDU5_9PSEU|nr:16S rRNA (guanine(527)-N(7))-methyltransferase RsmG [Saccharopolyspora karakumensis]TDD83745.1 16S rRNA (guanine(527)-N(7))-methyltransferase RsmG [Saccharopolyspora karakumensis]